MAYKLNTADYYMKDEIISKEMILKGLEKGVVRIINNPNDGEIAAQIGDYWFYFAGQENNELSVKEYLELYTNEEIAEYIEATINEDPINGYSEEGAGEWLYYRSVLHESGCKDFPTIEEIKNDYNELLGLIKDIRTIEQAMDFQRKYNTIVEINGYRIDEFVNGLITIDGRAANRGTNDDIEWIRYESFGCLSYIYDRFNGKPQFDVFSEKLEDEFIRNITIDDLSEENYNQWVYDLKDNFGETVVNTKINYLYRDANNYKVHNECVIKGTFSEKQKERIFDSLESGEFFIPGAVGLPAKRFSIFRDEVDHPWFELTEDDFEETIETATVNITTNELTKSFTDKKGNWEPIFIDTPVSYPYLSDCEDFDKIYAACSPDILSLIEESIRLYEETDLILSDEYNNGLYHKDGEPFLADAVAWYTGMTDTNYLIENFGDKNKYILAKKETMKESLTDIIKNAKGKKNDFSEIKKLKSLGIEK